MRGKGGGGSTRFFHPAAIATAASQIGGAQSRQWPIIGLVPRALNLSFSFGETQWHCIVNINPSVSAAVDPASGARSRCAGVTDIGKQIRVGK